MKKLCSYLLIASLVFVASSCGVFGGSSQSAPKLVEPVATALVPASDGYSFPNFESTSTQEQFDSSDLFAMFGAEVCVDGVTNPCEPIAEAAAWARMVNQARAPGHCEGLVVEASKRFNTGLSPVTVKLENQGEVTHQIFRAFATQFLAEAQKETLSWQKKSLRQIVDALGASFQTGSVNYSMGVYSEIGGHAILPYAVEFTDPDYVIVHIYDSNWPGKDRYVEIDLKAETWKFSFSGKDPANDPKAWTGGAGSLDLTSLDSRINSVCPFCASSTKVKNSMIVIKSTDNQWSITTDKGTYSPAKGDLVEGISARPIRASANQDTATASEFVVFVEDTDIDLTMSGATSAFVSNDNSVSQLTSTSSNQVKAMVSSNSISVDNPDVTLDVASGDISASAVGGKPSINIGEGQIKVSGETRDGQKFEVTADNKTPQVRATVPSGDIKDGPKFVVETRNDQNLTNRREVSNSGVETNTTGNKPLDLNGVNPNLPPALSNVNIKPGLPPAENRNLANPNYTADPPVKFLNAPNSIVPGGSVPGGSVPGGSVPGGSVPAGNKSVPVPGAGSGGSVPGGSVPGAGSGGSVPGAKVPNSIVPGAANNSGSSVPGAGSGGSAPAGNAPAASVPAGNKSVPVPSAGSGGSAPTANVPAGNSPAASVPSGNAPKP